MSSWVKYVEDDCDRFINLDRFPLIELNRSLERFTIYKLVASGESGVLNEEEVYTIDKRFFPETYAAIAAYLASK